MIKKFEKKLNKKMFKFKFKKKFKKIKKKGTRSPPRPCHWFWVTQRADTPSKNPRFRIFKNRCNFLLELLQTKILSLQSTSNDLGSIGTLISDAPQKLPNFDFGKIEKWL